MSQTKYRHIHFEDMGNWWDCRTNKDNTLLGTIDYYARWNCYVFEPSSGTVYSADCLNDIAHFIEHLPKKNQK